MEMSYEVRNLDLDNKLGEGRYGIVCKGMWREKSVAVKRIQLIHIASNKQGEEALQGLDHSNVIKLFHAESDANFR
jgi:serine/threonine protein kinase